MATLHHATADPKAGTRTLHDKLGLTTRLLAYTLRRRGMVALALATMLVAGATETGPIFLAKAFVEQILFTSKSLETGSLPTGGRAVLVTVEEGPRLFEEVHSKGVFVEASPLRAQAAKESGLNSDDVTRGLGEAISRTLGFRADGRLASLLAIAILILVVSLVAAAASYANSYIAVLLASITVNDLRLDMFEGLMRAPLARFTKEKSGDLVSRFATDAEQTRLAVSVVISELFLQPILVVAGVAAGFWISPRLALGAFIVVPLLAIPLAILGKKMKKRTRSGLIARADASEVFGQTIDGIVTVKTQGIESHRMDALRVASDQIQRAEVRIARTRSEGKALADISYGISLAVVLGFGGWLVMGGQWATTPGEFIGVLVAVATVFRPMKRIGDAWQSWSQALAGAERLFEIVDSPSDPALNGDQTPVAPLRDKLVFHNVGFSYPTAQNEQVLKGLDLEIPAGKTVAIVGASGAGKSTIIQLLMRLYDPTHGEVTYDGKVLTSIARPALLTQVAVVSQQPFLFNDTVESNIRVGRPDATDADIKHAAKLARVDEFISRLPQGYATVVGNRGASISGGQAQRITIARAILRNASVLLLDEATSNLDPESESLVQEALANAQAGRTTIVVAHRLTTIERADKIAVVDSGRVVEEGTHAELLSRNGAYARMHRRGDDSGLGLA